MSHTVKPKGPYPSIFLALNSELSEVRLLQQHGIWYPAPELVLIVYVALDADEGSGLKFSIVLHRKFIPCVCRNPEPRTYCSTTLQFRADITALSLPLGYRTRLPTSTMCRWLSSGQYDNRDLSA
jgi:hypothetical protein